MFVRTQKRSWRQKIRGFARIAGFAAALAAILLAADHLSQRPLITLLDRGGEQRQASLDETPPVADTDGTEGYSAPGTTERADAPVMDRSAPGAADDETAVAEAAEPPETDAASDGALAAPPRPSQRIVAVRRGDTLMDILLSLGISRAEAHEAVSALASIYDLRGLRPGQEITFTFAPGGPGEGQPLVGAWLAARADRDVGVARDEAGRFVPHQHDKELTLRPVRARGTVTSSLYEAGL